MVVKIEVGLLRLMNNILTGFYPTGGAQEAFWLYKGKLTTEA